MECNFRDGVPDRETSEKLGYKRAPGGGVRRGPRKERMHGTFVARALVNHRDKTRQVGCITGSVVPGEGARREAAEAARKTVPLEEVTDELEIEAGKSPVQLCERHRANTRLL